MQLLKPMLIVLACVSLSACLTEDKVIIDTQEEVSKDKPTLLEKPATSLEKPPSTQTVPAELRPPSE